MSKLARGEGSGSKVGRAAEIIAACSAAVIFLSGCAESDSDKAGATRAALSDVGALRDLGVCEAELIGDQRVARVLLAHAQNDYYRGLSKSQIATYSAAATLAANAKVPCEAAPDATTEVMGVKLSEDDLTRFSVGRLVEDGKCAEELEAELEELEDREAPNGLYKEAKALGIAENKYNTYLAALNGVECVEE